MSRSAAGCRWRRWAAHMACGAVFASAMSCGSSGLGASRPDTSPSVVAESVPELADRLVVSIEPWSFESGEGKVIVTPSYRIMTTATRQGMLDRMPRFMELALIQYTSSITPLPRPTRPMETFLMGTRGQWARMTQRVMGDEADVYLRIQRGGFSSRGRALLYDIGPRDTFAIAAHEGWHQYTQSVFKNSLSIALEEGLASYMEGFRWTGPEYDRPTFMPWANLERFDQLRQAKSRGRLIPLGRLMVASPQQLMQGDVNDALDYYAQTWALVLFLMEGEDGVYRGALKQMLSDAAEGTLLPRIQRQYGGRAAQSFAARRRGVDLLALYTGKSAEELDGPYQAFIAQIAQPGARSRIVQGLSPITP